MENEKSVINFGKYRGRPIEEIVSVDKNYIEWLMAQDWFKSKFEKTYNVVINYFNPEKNEDSPEHNRIQVKFLNPEFPLKIAQRLIGEKRFDLYFEKIVPSSNPLAEKLGSWNVEPDDICIDDVNYEVCGFDVVLCTEIDNNERVKQFKDQFELSNIFKELSEKWRTREELFKYFSYRRKPDIYGYNIYIEIKPKIGDDFPAVLRQIKRNLERVKNSEEHDPYIRKFAVLLTEEISTSNISADEVKAFFRNEKISLFLISEIEA